MGFSGDIFDPLSEMILYEDYCPPNYNTVFFVTCENLGDPAMSLQAFFFQWPFQFSINIQLHCNFCHCQFQSTASFHLTAQTSTWRAYSAPRFTDQPAMRTQDHTN